MVWKWTLILSAIVVQQCYGIYGSRNGYMTDEQQGLNINIGYEKEVDGDLTDPNIQSDYGYGSHSYGQDQGSAGGGYGIKTKKILKDHMQSATSALGSLFGYNPFAKNTYSLGDAHSTKTGGYSSGSSGYSSGGGYSSGKGYSSGIGHSSGSGYPHGSMHGGLLSSHGLSQHQSPSLYIAGGGPSCSAPTIQPSNAQMKCTLMSNTCKVTCLQSHQFPNGDTSVFLSCINGEWIIKDSEWDEVPSCEPICSPPCLNNGICIQPGLCQCPENFIGPQCEKEKKFCLNPPPLPKNSKRSCSSTACTITCATGYRFADGTSIANLICKNEKWTPTRSELTSIPDCQPVCTPNCQNGGHCLSYNVCQCPPEYRGPQCQHNVESCSPKKMNFNGAYNCSGDNNQIKCILSCPQGVEFEFAPSEQYVCKYAVGLFEPISIPKCHFTEDMEIVDLGGSLNTFYKTSNRTHIGHTKIKKKKKKYRIEEGEEIEDDGSEEDQTWEKIITKTKIKIIKGKKSRGKKVFVTEDEYEEIESEEEEEDEVPGVYSLYLSNQMGMVHRTPKPAVCMTWNGNKFKTFDGLIYNRNLHCSHTLVQDYVDGSFSVILRACPLAIDSACTDALEIFLQTMRYTFDTDEGMVRLFTTKKQLPIPAQLPGMRVALVGHRLNIGLDAIGLTIGWDGHKLVTIEATAGLWNRTAGLCGTLDQNINNDFMSKDGTLHKMASTFVDSWRAPTLDVNADKCSMETQNDGLELECPEEMQNKAFAVCRKLLANPKLEHCLQAFDKESLLRTCISDYCYCVDPYNPSKCACDGVSVFAKDCQFKGIMLENGWRDLEICPMICKGGRTYQPCGPTFEPSCGSTTEISTGSCNEGCFCPPGLIQNNGKCVEIETCPCTLRGRIFQPGAIITKDCNTCACKAGTWKCSDITCGARCGVLGDPHYRTFDGKRFDFMGKCSYHLLKTESFSIEAENVACPGSISEMMNFGPSGSDMPSCTKSVTINMPIGGLTKSIKLKQGRQVLVDGLEIPKLPIRILDSGLKIRQASSTMIVVSFSDGLKVWWDGMTRVYIDAPAIYRDKTMGLCGTFNANIQDDFLTPEGDIESSTSSFADKWRTKETCQYVSGSEIPHPCQLNIEKVEMAKNMCTKLKEKIFEDCHWSVDPEPFYEDCLYDVCACQFDPATCLCPIFGSYAAECSRQGVIVNWRHLISECAVKCPLGQVFEECGDDCYRTCEDLQSDEPCKTSCVEGCRCPPGQSLDDLNECIPTKMCPCSYKGLKFNAGYKEVRPGKKYLELCTCSGAKWSCTEAKDGDAQKYPPASDIRSKCLMAENQEFTTCEPAERITCKNMHSYQPSTTVECHPGCVCKKGFVFDSIEKKCVLPQDCSCHHGSKSYNDGEKILNDCNTCVCKAGTWECSNDDCPATCTSWGHSHFDTFDGKDFDFQGACSYVLSKGSLDGGEGYSITIQNVLCGSLGVTCSKSVTVTITGVHKESITLASDLPIPGLKKSFEISNEIPSSNELSKLSVHRAGIFVIAEAAGMGLQVKWDRGTRVYVKLNNRWKGRVQGLCGNYNGDAQDDLQTPSSGIETSALIFGDSWKLQDFCAKPTEQVDTCMEHPQRKTWAQRQCGILKSEVFQRCHSEVLIEKYLKRCMYDACACDQGGDCECLCTALATYAHACSMKGIHIRWRTPDLCPMQCDPHCSEYTPCVSSCPVETCDNVLDQAKDQRMCTDDTCLEGCKLKACPSDKIYKNETYSECVPKATCKPECLVMNGVTYYEGDIVRSDECHSCRCTRGKEICSGQPCTTPGFIYQVTTSRPFKDTEEKCQSGWTPWINQDKSDAGLVKGLKIGDLEPMPTEFVMRQYGKVSCALKFIKQIECRSSITQLAPKVTGEDVECSLERGLICAGPCHDYEIRVLCDCGDEIEIFTLPPTPASTSGRIVRPPPTDEGHHLVHKTCDPAVPHIEYPGDCYKFLHCEPDIDGSWKYALKTCGPSMMFNPPLMICDWPASVILMKPMCGDARLEPLETVEIVTLPFTPPLIQTPLASTPMKLIQPTPSSLPLIRTTFASIQQLTTIPSFVPPIPVKPIHKTCDMFAVPHIEYPGDCHKFLHCEPDIDGTWKYAEKTCGPSMMFNPTLMICDWPFSVMAMKPSCGETQTEKPEKLQKCPPGQVWSDCAKPCGKSCHYYGKTLRGQGLCTFDSDPCEEGCVEATSLITCPANHLWRDRQACVTKADCTCMSFNGKLVKPGAVFKESECEICQCIDSSYICDSSACEQKITMGLEEKHPVGISKIPKEIGTTTPQPGIKKPKPKTTVPPFVIGSQTTLAPLIIVPSTVTPPLLCDESKLLPMIEGKNPLPNEAFDASSILGPSFAAASSRLSARPTESSSGSWSPKINDQMQYLQIAFPKPVPLFGVKSRGSPIFDQYVTSFKILHSFDGIAFHYLVDETKTPQIFRGPIDSRTPIQTLFKIPIESKVLRIYPLTWHESIAMRVEILGCSVEEEKILVKSTTPMPISIKTTHQPITIFEEDMPCDEPMGVDDGKMSPKQVRVSSTKTDSVKSFDMLKLSSKKGWSPHIDSPNEFVLFDFTELRKITGIKTMGGEYGWVTAYHILYSQDELIWNKVQELDGTPKVFPANYDSDSIQVNNFKYPLNLRYLKIVPIKWHDTIEFKVEPMGCFKPYPILAEKDVEIFTTPSSLGTTDTVCGKCPGVMYAPSPIEGVCRCYPPLYWNGNECIPKQQCPCMVGHIQYEIGAHYEADDCSKCICVLGGQAQCKPQECPPCRPGLRPIKSATCMCLCEPCPNGQVLCPSSGACIPEKSWCDGIQDCPDDEINCMDKTKEGPKVITKIEEKLTIIKTCPDPLCPPGFTIKETRKVKPKLSPMFQLPSGVKTIPGIKNPYRKSKMDDKYQSTLPIPENIEKDLEDECIEYICIPSKPVVQLSKEPEKPIKCPEPECQKGYNIVMETGILPGIAGNCAKYSCEPIPRHDVICNITGRTFSTFDSTEFKYDICNHLLARDLVADKWSITILKNCTAGNYVCKKELQVRDKESSTLITFYTDLTLSLGGYRFTVDQLQKSTVAKTFVVSRVGNTIIFVSHVHGFWVTFDEYGDVKVGVSSTLVTEVDGLCGYFNNNPLDDKRLPNGEPSLSTVDFGDSWFVDRSTESMCQPHACPKNLQDMAWEMCNAVKQDTFKACGKVVNIDRFISKCLETACDCLKESTAVEIADKSKLAGLVEMKKCKCSMLQNFAVECLAADENIHLDTWRSVHECQVTCPPPMVHHDCYRRRCEPSCDTLKTDACPHLPGTCFSGCYCPEGMVSNKNGQCVPVSECKDCVCDGFGKSQYLTYDRQNFTFDGNCTYLLSRDLIVQDVHTFQVYTTLGPCPAADSASPVKGIKTKAKKKNTGSCTEALHILYGEHIIHLQREKGVVKTLVDGIYAKELPLKNDWIEISEQQNREIKIDLRKSQVEVHAAFEDLAFSIRVPSVKYGFKMEGLCGDCNGNPNDDLKLNPKAKLTKEKTTFKDIMNSWLSDSPVLPTEDKCLSEEESQLDCLPLPPETDPCLLILDSDIFGQCNFLVDPLLYLSMCQADMCKTGLNQLGACSHIAAYAKECSRNNLCIDWKKGVCKDDQKCPEGMVYEACGCPKTCENLKEKPAPKSAFLSKDLCPVSRIEGCMCPPGKVLHNGKCILENQCSPCDDKEHYPGDKWFPDICTACECGSNSTVTCLKKECASKGTVCEQGWKQLILEEKGECCPIYKCVPEPTQPPPLKCLETLLPECGPDQYNKLQTGPDGCPKYICECKPTDECKPLETLTPEAGEKIVTESAGCCPVNKMVCDKSRCPAKPIKCDNPFFNVHELKPKKLDQCCPEYECKPPADKCIVEIEGSKKMVNLGETLPTSDPCIMDKCIKEPDGSLSMEGLLQECLVSSCDPGFTLFIEPNQCCGKCVQVKCVLGKMIYEPEQEWPGTDNCTTFKCSKDKLTSQMIITSMQPTCPDVSGCPEKFLYSDGCCKLCKPIVEDQKNCAPTSLSELSTLELIEKETLEHGLCTNIEPIRGFTECHGSCSSGTKYSKSAKKQIRHCDCCSIGSMENVKVKLKCSNGVIMEMEISVPKSCSCQPCQENAQLIDVRMMRKRRR